MIPTTVQRRGADAVAARLMQAMRAGGVMGHQRRAAMINHDADLPTPIEEVDLEDHRRCAAMTRIGVDPQPETTPAKKKLGFSIAKASAREVLDKIVGESDTRYFVTKGGVVIADLNTEILPMETIFIPMPARIFQSVNEDGSIHDHHARNVLKSAGINFPRGASAAYNPSTGRLAIRNTKQNLELVINQYVVRDGWLGLASGFR